MKNDVQAVAPSGDLYALVRKCKARIYATEDSFCFMWNFLLFVSGHYTIYRKTVNEIILSKEWFIFVNGVSYLVFWSGLYFMLYKANSAGFNPIQSVCTN